MIGGAPPMKFLVKLQHPDPGRSGLAEKEGEVLVLGAGTGDVSLDLPGIRGVLVRVRAGRGGLELKAADGAPIPILLGGQELGARFQPLFEGENLEIGDYRIEISWQGEELEGLDVASLGGGEGEGLAGWFEEFISLADRMEGVRDLEELARAAMEGVLATTGADRVFLMLEREEGGPREWFRSRLGGDRPFGVSRSLVRRVADEKAVVFVPRSASDPSVAGLLSVRREGISSSVVVPLRALGGNVGVLYADCIEPGHSLGPADFQKAALLGRLLAGAVGNRQLVRRVMKDDGPLPEALRTKSPACADMVEKARLGAPTSYTILIRGETGSGKDLCARAIHELSKRASGPFVAVNCAAIPSALMESELFGHARGAFTGADRDRDGFFVAAEGGTLFLDEIGDMDLDLQAKILRALETREIVPVGGRNARKVDVRILAATHRDLEAMVEKGAFRGDLYYRLRELEIRLPPLRERPEDLLPLAERFLEEAALELGRGPRPGLSPEASARLLEHDWPGNIRELRHAMRGAALSCTSGRVGPGDLDLQGLRFGEETPKGDSAGVPPGGWKERLERQEREALEATLREAGGNLTKAAALFGLPRTTYRERLIRHGLL